jgi:ribosomal protein S8
LKQYITNKCWQKININFFDGENLKQFCERINNQVKEFIIEKIYNNGFLFIQTVKSLETEENVEKIKKSIYDKENKNNKLSVIDNIQKTNKNTLRLFL